MGPEARYGFQGIRSEAEDVFPKRREDLETAPQPLGCKRRGEAERGKEKGRPGAADSIGLTPYRPNRHFTQSRDCGRLALTGGEADSLGVSRLLGQ
jgi:hypothetical protein